MCVGSVITVRNLVDMGLSFSIDGFLSIVISDWIGLVTVYFPILSLAFIFGLCLGFLTIKYACIRSWLACWLIMTISTAVSILVLHLGLNLILGFGIIASARTPQGLILLMFAGVPVATVWNLITSTVK